jgi:hypothetical protein
MSGDLFTMLSAALSINVSGNDSTFLLSTKVLRIPTTGTPQDLSTLPTRRALRIIDTLKT